MRLNTILTLPLGMILLTACTTTGSDRPSDYCLLTDYILVSEEDELTTRTAGDILMHNELREMVCSK